MDIENYYPSINHNLLLKRVRKQIRKPQLVELIKNAIETPTGKANIPNNVSKEGVPQGLSISNILSSVYLSNLDFKYKDSYKYYRYVDDILVICKCSEAEKIYEGLKADLWKKTKLKSHPLDPSGHGKTMIASFSDGVDYLGFRITDTSVSVRPSSYKRMFVNLSKVFTAYKYSKNKDRLLWRLNLKISGCVFEGKRLGWVYFFSQTEDTAQLKRLDAFVVKLLKKYGLIAEVGNIKTFTKTYHEIRFNADKTKYIPNFEKFTLAQMQKTICLLTKYTEVEVDAWDVVTVREQFRKCTFREVVELERDLLEMFS